MSESHVSEARPGERGDAGLSDSLFRWLGLATSVLFSIATIVFLVAAVAKVDVSLLVEIIHPQFVNAFLIVLGIFIVAALLSLAGGMLVGLGRVSNTRFTYGVATVYVEFFRGTPLLFQIVMVYFGIPELWPGAFPPNWKYPAAIIALTLNHSAYIGEAVRGGIDAVPDGQMEAARSLGMGYVESMREVVLPQAWRNALAAIGNDLVIVIKDTSLLTFIAVPELIDAFRTIYSATFDAWTPILLVAIAYLTLTVPLGFLVRYMERRATPGGGDQ